MKKILLLLSILFFAGFSYAQNIDEEKLVSDFDAYVCKLQKEWNIPGMAVCAVVDGKVVYKKVFGVRSAGKADTVDFESIFQTGSCTKAFSSVLAAILVDKGYFKWTDRVVKYLPDFKLYDSSVTQNITIEDLLSQYSGLPAYSQHFMMLFGYDKDFIINSMRYIKPIAGFKKEYGYQNNMYLVFGEVVKSATGKSWNENIEEYILNTLGMKQTTTDLSGFMGSKDKTSGHYYAGGNLVPVENSTYCDWPYTFAPAGAVNTNLDDMSKWLLFLTKAAAGEKETIVSSENFHKILEKKIFVSKTFFDKTKNNYYCMGWRLSEYDPEDYYWHGGATDGEGAFVSFLKSGKAGIVVLMNLPNGRMADALTKKLYDLYYQKEPTDWGAVQLAKANESAKAKNKVLAKKPKTITPPLSLEKYAGNYKNILYGDAKIILEDGNLKLSAGNFKTWIILRHFNADKFNGYGVPGWSFKKPLVTFFTDSKRKNVTGFVVESMTDGIETVFSRAE